ncbi:hypothetical protein Y1Q_0018701 [Alligator mississippiensis]|uniref:Uncharacterized protein n=1 Tax=Alligator mississippiensis TaxID=8496 RepID=A0A151NS23_ALLMI|nr:hypothetical protein Y1Q_0018701 [Alligator mississippiensis]
MLLNRLRYLGCGSRLPSRLYRALSISSASARSRALFSPTCPGQSLVTGRSSSTALFVVIAARGANTSYAQAGLP